MRLDSDKHEVITEETTEDLLDFAKKAAEEYTRFNKEKMGY